MNPEQTFDLLTQHIAPRDGRTVGKVDATVWHADVGDLSFDDACAAVSLHFRQSTDWLMPKHLRDLVKKIRTDRLEGFVYVPGSADEDTATYLQRFREQRAADASGQREADPTPQLGTEENRKAVAEVLAAVFPNTPKRRRQ